MKRIPFILTLILSAAPAIAIQPQSGFWAIDGELNGQPGRGFQIDVQGETLIFSYYGYRPDGSATFYLSSGRYDVANGKYSGQLLEYKGGTPIGQAFRSGSEAGSPGSFALSFINSNKGYMALPGEELKPISRFTFSDPSAKFNNKQWDGNIYGRGYFYSDKTKFDFVLRDGKFNLTQDSFQSGKCIYSGEYFVKGEELESYGSYKCSDFTEGSYSASQLKVGADGTYTGSIFNMPVDGSPGYTVYHTAR